MSFKYEIIKSHDKAWGNKISFVIWNGSFGMLEREEADIGFLHLKVMVLRKEVAEFCIPYDVAHKTFAMQFSQPL